MPLRNKPAIAFAEITGPYAFDENAEDPYYHSREVKWLTAEVPRSTFDQDLLYSFGAFMTICRVSRNNAEARIRALAEAGWKSTGRIEATPVVPNGREDEEEGAGPVDLEQLAKDQIAKLVIAKFKGHGMARLVEAILQAQGYTTFRSPEGADKGVDIVAGAGPLGFGRPPDLCAGEVRSGSGRPSNAQPADRDHAERPGPTGAVGLMGWLQVNRRAGDSTAVLPGPALGPGRPHRTTTSIL
jgi:restriction system protein